MAVSLPDDVLLEILACLKDDDAAPLFRCAMVCKRWRGLVTDPSFLRRCWPDDACPSFAGFFMKKRLRNQGAKVLVPMPRSALGRGRRSLSSFVPGSTHLLYRAVPLVSRGGLVLVRLTPHQVDQERWVVHLAVCNLLIGTCNVLPPLECFYLASDHYYESCGCAVLTGADCRSGEVEQSSNSSFFKVVIIVASNPNGLKLDVHTFSSDKESWSTLADQGFDDHMDAAGYGAFSHSDAIVRHGTAHWLFRDFSVKRYYVFGLKAVHGQVSITRLPFEMTCYTHRPRLSIATNGMISVLRMQNTAGSQLETWTQQEDQQQQVDSTSEWLCTQTIELMQPKKEVTSGCEPYILAEKRGTLLINDGHRRVYTADLEAGTLEEVADWPRIRATSCPDVVPFEIDWPSFFISRLLVTTRDSMLLPLLSPSSEAALRRRARRWRRGSRQRRLALAWGDKTEGGYGC